MRPDELPIDEIPERCFSPRFNGPHFLKPAPQPVDVPDYDDLSILRDENRAQALRIDELEGVVLDLANRVAALEGGLRGLS